MLGGFVTPAGCTWLNLELSIFYALATASIFSTLSVIFSFLTVFLLHTAMMASFNMGQLPAHQTKVEDHGLGPLKAGPTRLCAPVCNHDVCGAKVVRLVCMCMNVVLFIVMLLIRFITYVVSPSLSMNCSTENIMY